MDKIKVNLDKNKILRSKNIEYKNETLKDYLDNYIKEYSLNEIQNWCLNNWSTNGKCFAFVEKSGIKHLVISIRNGTNARCLQLPEDMRPETTLLCQGSNFSNSGYIQIWSDGNVDISTNLYSEGNSTSILFNITYI